MHIMCIFVQSLYNMHQCFRCIFGHLLWTQSLNITLATPRLAVIELHIKLQAFSLSISRDNWSWLKHFLPRLNRFNPNWANPPIYSTDQTPYWPGNLLTRHPTDQTPYWPDTHMFLPLFQPWPVSTTTWRITALRVTSLGSHFITHLCLLLKVLVVRVTNLSRQL